MSGELWLATGTIVAALLALAGVIYNAKNSASTETVRTLSEALKNMGQENNRLNTRVGELEREVAALKEELVHCVEANRQELERVYAELGRKAARRKTGEA